MCLSRASTDFLKTPIGFGQDAPLNCDRHASSGAVLEPECSVARGLRSSDPFGCRDSDSAMPNADLRAQTAVLEMAKALLAYRPWRPRRPGQAKRPLLCGRGCAA